MRKTPEFEDCFAELIRLPSVSSIDPAHDQSNRQIIDTLANYFDALGFDCEIMSVSNSPEKCNLIAKRGENKSGDNAGLVLSGHTDTVPYDLNGWDTDPFTLTKKEECYYGLGTADMKSFFPIILETLERLADTKFSAPITVVATADEESTMSGARLIQQNNKVSGRYCIIGEPTGLKPIHSHKGIIIETIHIEGRSGHSSDPTLGNSALEGMHDVMTALREWREELQAEYRNEGFKLPVPTMNFGRIHGGDSPNRICANCELSLDLRMLPGMKLEELSEQLKNRVKQTLASSGLKVEFNNLFNGIPPMQTSKDSEIISLSEVLTKHHSECVAFGTEGPFYNDMGIETVILGPGDIDVAHQPNEYLQIDRIEPMINILSKMLLHFCKG
ncbi:MAG: acetylornithine deacetylase [Gammaproteobacteria bacterium]|jgi:acetylornithine deacetylase